MARFLVELAVVVRLGGGGGAKAWWTRCRMSGFRRGVRVDFRHARTPPVGGQEFW